MFGCMRSSLKLSTEIFEELTQKIGQKLPSSKTELTKLVLQKKSFDKKSKKLISKLEDLYILLT